MAEFVEKGVSEDEIKCSQLFVVIVTSVQSVSCSRRCIDHVANPLIMISFIRANGVWRPVMISYLSVQYNGMIKRVKVAIPLTFDRKSQEIWVTLGVINAGQRKDRQYDIDESIDSTLRTSTSVHRIIIPCIMGAGPIKIFSERHESSLDCRVAKILPGNVDGYRDACSESTVIWIDIVWPPLSIAVEDDERTRKFGHDRLVLGRN